MGRYVEASCRLCRRERQKLFLKGVKCYTDKCPLEKRNYPPGQHALRRRQKVSEYGVQLREKQKVKRMYGVYEQQFRNYFEMATHQKGRTGENLLRLLERRLDNVLFRLGFAPSRKSARQLVLHGHFLVNNKSVDIASYLVKPGTTHDLENAFDRLKSYAVPHKKRLLVIEDNDISGWGRFGHNSDLTGWDIGVNSDSAISARCTIRHASAESL